MTTPRRTSGVRQPAGVSDDLTVQNLTTRPGQSRGLPQPQSGLRSPTNPAAPDTLEEFAKQIGREHGAKTVRIEGGMRKMGTDKPRMPRPQEIEVD